MWMAAKGSILECFEGERLPPWKFQIGIVAEAAVAVIVNFSGTMKNALRLIYRHL